MEQRIWELAEQQAIENAHGELEIHMPTRAFRVLWRLLNRQDLKVTPQTVAGLTARELMAQDGFGRKSLADVEGWLGHYGLRLVGAPRAYVSLYPTEGKGKPWYVSLHTTEGKPSPPGDFPPWAYDGSMALLADALDVLHA